MKLVFTVAALLSLCSAAPTTPGAFVLDLSGGLANIGGGAAAQPGTNPSPPGNIAPQVVDVSLNYGPLELTLAPQPGDVNPQPAKGSIRAWNLGPLELTLAPQAGGVNPQPATDSSLVTNLGPLDVTLAPPARGVDAQPVGIFPDNVQTGFLAGNPPPPVAGGAHPHAPAPGGNIDRWMLTGPQIHQGVGGAMPPIIDHGGLMGTGSAPASAPATGANVIDWTCEGYRAHPSNPNMYQVFFNMQWANYTCFGILTWNQTLCSCVIPADTGYVDPNCPNNRAVATDPTLYQIKHWGVWLTLPKRCPMNTLWNQTGCRCDWDPIGPGAVVDAPVGGLCDLMFNATFNYELLDDANYNSIGRDPWFNVKVENGSARLDNGRMPVWAFASNDFAKQFQIQFNFKLDANVATAKQYTTLVSNGCSYDRPSIGISYRPIDQSYSVYFRDVFLENTLECTSPSLTPYDFQSVSLEYQYSQLYLKVNGQVCLQSSIFGGDIAISRCPFYLGGDGLLQYMSGNIDEVVVRRFCVSPA